MLEALKHKKIDEITRDDLLNDDFYIARMEDMDELEMQRFLTQLKSIAPMHGVKLGDVTGFFTAAKKVLKEKEIQNYSNTNGIRLEWGDKGPANTIENYLRVLREDIYFSNIYFNLLTESPEREINGVRVPWDDTSDAEARHYIEHTYKLNNPKKYDDAIRILFREREYHPIKDAIEEIEWDGVPRCTEILVKYLCCEDTPYIREVSRLIFAGGINRLYHPGCKFDDVPILVGTNQGEGKSTFCRFLAIKDDYFTEINEMDGQKGSEAVEGAWICEVPELSAMTRQKEVESVKAFITRTQENYRKPYDKRKSVYKRQCIFIGTTNKKQFLTDKTGNRRFYPVLAKSSGYTLLAQEQEIREYIKQCWAEAKAKLGTAEMKPFADYSLHEEIKRAQYVSAEEDWREGLILDWANHYKEICILQVWAEALQELGKPTRRDSNDISLILQKSGQWECDGTVRRFEHYSVQKVWKRIGTDKDRCIFEDDEGNISF